MQNKTKKRIGIVAMALVLLAAICATAGVTLAKYVSSATVQTQQATVAKWGFTLTADTSKMFGTQYGVGTTTPGEATFATIDQTSGIVVKTTADGKIVAPGTKGEMAISVAGTAEVNAKLELTIDPSAFKTIKLSDGTTSNDYYPIVWKVRVDNGSTSGNATSATANTVEAIATAMNTALSGATLGTGVTASTATNGVSINIPANTNLSSVKIVISWEWAFETTNGSSGNRNNEDTLLGYLAAGATYDGTGSTIAVQNVPNMVTFLGGAEGASAKFTLYKNNSSTEIAIGLSAQFVQVQDPFSAN